GSDRMVGLLINTVPVPIAIDRDAEPGAWLRQVQTAQRDAQLHGHVPLSRVQACSAVPRGVPLFETLVVFENYPRLAAGSASERGEGPPPLGVALRPSVARTNYPLTLAVMPGERFTLRLTVDLALVDESVSLDLLPRLERMLQALLARAGRVEDLLAAG